MYVSSVLQHLRQCGGVIRDCGRDAPGWRIKAQLVEVTDERMEAEVMGWSTRTAGGGVRDELEAVECGGWQSTSPP